MSTVRTTSFGDLLRRFRLAAGLTQEELAERAGLSRRGITDLERGARTTPHRETLGLLADALGLADDDRAAFVATARRRSSTPPAPSLLLAAPSSARVDVSPIRTRDTHRHNLPVQPTPLLGREEQAAALTGLLRRSDVRLVTLTGPGGIGKTRLSFAVATELVDDFADGVWFVRLSRLSDPDLVMPTVAQTLGLKEAGSLSTAELLREHLCARQTLLVLDNFEQVVQAAPEVSTLLEASPGLTVLVTSRIPLRLRGEKTYTLAPLSLPRLGETHAPERLAHYASVALFIERARDARSDFAVTAANAPAITAICTQLDGLPLAIELAAARVRVLPPEALLARLSSRLTLLTGGARDTEARQQTMRNTLAWSYDLLAPELQVLFRRLTVFVGGCTLEAAEAVCAAPEGAAPLGFNVLDGLSTLVDESLVQQREDGGEARFGMLHVIREYALEQLEASGEAQALRRTHLAYYAALVEPMSLRGIRGLQGTYWRARLEREHDNLRAALGWACERGEVELGLRLANVLAEFWLALGNLREGRTWLDTLLALRDEDRAPTRAWAIALGWAAGFAINQGDVERAVSLLEEALAVGRAVGDRVVAVAALRFLGSIVVSLGETTRGVTMLEESVAQARQMDRDGEMDTRLTTVQKAAESLSQVPGEEDRAAALAEENRELARRAGRPVYEAQAGYVLALCALRRGDVAEAEVQAVRALRLARDLGFQEVALQGVEPMGLVASRVGHAERAARLLGAVAQWRESMGYRDDPLWHRVTEAMIAPARAALGEEAWASAFAAGRALSLEAAIAEALGEERRDA